MVKVMSLQEWADATGRPIAELEEMVAEAEMLGEMFDINDPVACQEHGWTDEIDAAFAEFIRRARERANGTPCN